MTSELRVDKIHNEGGDNDSGIDLSTNDQIVLKTANTTRLTMNSTGQTTIVGEGGSVTTSVQQGLTKAWWLFDQANSNTLRDSLNVSSIADNSTGNMTATITNDFSSSTNYSTACCLAYQNDTIANAFRGNGNIVRAAGTLQWICVYVSSTAGAGTVEDDDENSWQLCGELA